MDRIGSWGQMIKMNWLEILGYIGIIPRILTMIPVRENNEVAIKFTQISSYIIVVTNNVVWFVILIKHNYHIILPIQLPSSWTPTVYPCLSHQDPQQKPAPKGTSTVPSGAAQELCGKACLAALAASAELCELRSELRGERSERSSTTASDEFPWENPGKTIGKPWRNDGKWWNMMENLDFVKKIWWFMACITG